MTIPLVGADGVRQTVNANLTPAQTTWNLRSALNVAALNCLKPQYAGILPAYKSFLETHARKLSATNRTLQSEFRQKYGPTYRDVQDAYMTQVYNYFALPPALDDFCTMSLAVATEMPKTSKEDIDLYASTALPRIESVFEDFFRAYEQYRVNLTAWNAQYGPPTVSTTVQGYTNPLDPNTPVAVGTTPVGDMPATQPVVVAGEDQAPIDLPPATGPNGTLPTSGPIFKSGEVVQKTDEQTPNP